MKVLCTYDLDSIGNKSTYVTKGRWYDVVSPGSSEHMFYIVSDNETYPAVEKKNFITIEEYRSNKLKQLGI